MYVGNKGKIVNDILKFIPANKTFIDLFCGTGVVGKTYQQKYGGELYLNDIDDNQIAYIQYLSSGKPLPMDRWVSREEFMDIRDGKVEMEKGLKRLLLLSWSFGNNKVGYLYGKNIENKKHSIHKLHFGQSKNPKGDLSTIYNSMTYIGRSLISLEQYLNELLPLYDRGYIYRNELNNPLKKYKIPKYTKRKEIYTDEYKARLSGIDAWNLQSLEGLQSLESLQSLERLQSLQSLESLGILESLERLQRLQRLESLESNNTYYSSISYVDFDLSQFKPESTVVYLDPPYEGTAEYEKGQTQWFDYDFFRDWFNSHSLPMIASSYGARPHIYKIADIYKRITLSGPQVCQNSKEKLFANKVYLDLYG